MSRKFALFTVACMLTFGALVLGHLPVLAGQTQTSVRPTADYVVNSLDNADDGSCDVTHCSLREAIAQADMNIDADTITFSVSGTIVLTSTLPPISGTLTIDGGRLITVSGASAYQVLHVNPGAALTLNAIAIADGASDSGGGIDNEGTLTMTTSTLIDNSAHVGGGGIFNGGTLTVIDCTFSGNMSDLELTYSTMRGGGGGGGGIYNNGTLTVTDSTFSGNNAVSQVLGPSIVGDGGGGIYNNGTLTVTNSTFSSNYVTGFAILYCCPEPFFVYGGGISNQGILTITNSTFAGNSATMLCSGPTGHTEALNSLPGISVNSIPASSDCLFDGYGGGIYNAGTVTLRNTIVANSPVGDNCYGGVTNGGNNLDSGTSCGWGTDNGSLSKVDPLLFGLADNGGSTLTMRLWPGSPATDGVTFSAPNDCPATDQRGVPRPTGPRCDIGAYEADVPLHFYLPVVVRAAA